MKNRQLISAEYAIKECFRHVKMPVLENAIGKSDGFIYKCGDPDEIHQMSVHDALLMDAAVYAETKATAPFRDLFCRNIALAAPGRDPDGSLRDLTLSLQSELGDLARRVGQATHAGSENGARISPNETAMLMADLEDIQAGVTKIYVLLGAGIADAG